MARKINLENIVLIPSKDRYELELAKWGSEESARKRFSSGQLWNRVLESHHRQKMNLQEISRIGVNFMDRSQLVPEIIQKKDLFVILGGDNHFTYCCQEVLRYEQSNPDNQKLVLGCVLDPSKSVGALLYFDTQSFLGNLDNFEKGLYELEHWTALEAKVDGEVAYPAVGDYFVGEKNRLYMSRNLVYLEGKQILPEKSSGLLVVAGAGSGPGSWYDNIHCDRYGRPDSFAKSEECCRIIATEEKSRSKAVMSKAQTLIIESYNDDKGIIVPDSHIDHGVAFGMGSSCKIVVSDTKLHVVRPIDALTSKVR
ncbi:MAG: hypothetical protein ABIF10_07835 [Candidatus Woesearchaeota archaeon]